MNILLITDLYPLFEEQKNVPKAIEDFVLAISELGHNIFVYRPDLVINTIIRGRKPQKSELYYNKGIKIYNKNFLFCNFSNENFLKNENFDVIISHMPTGNICAREIAKKYNKPYIAIVHSSDLEVIKNPLYKIYFKNKLLNSLNEAKLVGARSFWLKEEIEKILQRETFVLPSGIKAELVAKDEITEKFKNKKPFKIVATAQLIKRKNLKNLLLALSQIKDFDWELSIFGEGKEKRKLEKIAELHKLNVVFEGKKTRDKVIEKLKSAHLFILPSIKETFGISLLEGLSQGCVCVCLKNSAMSGFIQDEINGFLCNKEIEDIKGTIKKIYFKDEKELIKIAQKGLKTARELEYYECAKKYLENIKKIFQ